MLSEALRKAIDKAFTGTDRYEMENWNSNFVQKLCDNGCMLIDIDMAIQFYGDNWIQAPYPYNKGWQYSNPCAIVMYGEENVSLPR